MNFAIKDVPVGQLNALVKNLMAQMDINDPVEVIRRINAGEWLVAKVELPEFPIWKTVTIGNLGDVKTARQRLKDSGIELCRDASFILETMTFNDTEVILDLVRVSAKELGLENCWRTEEIYAAAERHGLSLCPAEVAPQLWLTYPSLLPCGECLRVAMETMKSSNCCWYVLSLECAADGRKLYADRDHNPMERWERDSWVFVRG